jgi:hypothetical protein
VVRILPLPRSRPTLKGKAKIVKRKTLKIIGLSLLAGMIVGMGLFARPLVDRLVESVTATDQEKNS